MEQVYTVLAAFVVTALVNGVKYVSAWVSQKLPTLPSWVRNLVPLWKLLTAIAVTILVVWASKKWAVELSHPLVILVIAQITHEVTDSINKARKKNEDTPE